MSITWEQQHNEKKNRIIIKCVLWVNWEALHHTHNNNDTIIDVIKLKNIFVSDEEKNHLRTDDTAGHGISMACQWAAHQIVPAKKRAAVFELRLFYVFLF